jgi:hypothetical protein
MASNDDLFLAEKATAIRTLTTKVGSDLIEIGKHLTEAKARAGHGRFGMWLKKEFAWSESTAQRFMRVYKVMSTKIVTVTDLPDIEARSLYLITAKSTPEVARKEVIERTTNGETLSHGKVRGIVAKAKPTKQARNGDAKPIKRVDPVVEAAVERAVARSEETKRRQAAAAGNDVDPQTSADQRKTEAQADSEDCASAPETASEALADMIDNAFKYTLPDEDMQEIAADVVEAIFLLANLGITPKEFWERQRVVSDEFEFIDYARTAAAWLNNLVSIAPPPPAATPGATLDHTDEGVPRFCRRPRQGKPNRGAPLGHVGRPISHAHDETPPCDETRDETTARPRYEMRDEIAESGALDATGRLRVALLDASQGNVDPAADISPIRALLEQGCDLQADVVPIVAREVPELPRPLKNWGAPWLAQDILAARDQRLRDGKSRRCLQGA